MRAPTGLPMIARIIVLAVIALAFARASLTSAESMPAASVSLVRGVASQWENDNNVIEELFQNFNGNENDDGGSKKRETVGPLPPPVSAPASIASATDTQVRVRAGRETTVFLTDDHVALRAPAALQDDLEVTIRLVTTPPSTPPPGPVIGDLLFMVAAQEPGGQPLAQLPLEANLSARYTDAQLAGRDEGRLALSWLDPADNTWKAAPKPAADARNNYISATIQNLGLYAVHQAP